MARRIAELMRDFTDEGDLILDPWAGHCTVARVAKDLGRRCISVELDEAERLADHVVIFDQGEVIADGTLDELRRGHDEIRFRSSPDLDTLAKWAQKQGLKNLVLKVLTATNEGLNRKDISARFGDNDLEALGLQRNDKLPDKLRQPLLELVRESRIRSEGEKRLLVYLPADATPPRARQKGKKTTNEEATQ